MPALDSAQVRELLKRNKQLEQETRSSAAPPPTSPGTPSQMMYPLVCDLAVDGVPVAVTCRVLGFSKQAYFAWRACPVTDRDWSDAHLLNAAVDIHHDDPEFGYRFITHELAQARVPAIRNRVNRLCTQQRLWSVHARKRGLSRHPGPPVHDDLVTRQFRSARPNLLWLTDIPEHPTAEGKLYLCAVKDACSNRIVGYSIADRMTSQLAVDALHNAVALRRRPALWSTPIAAASFVHTPTSKPSALTACTDQWAGSGRVPTTQPWNRSSSCSRRASSTATQRISATDAFAVLRQQSQNSKRSADMPPPLPPRPPY